MKLIFNKWKIARNISAFLGEYLHVLHFLFYFYFLFFLKRGTTLKLTNHHEGTPAVHLESLHLPLKTS